MMRKIYIGCLMLLMCVMLNSTALAHPAPWGNVDQPHKLLVVTKNTGWRLSYITCDRGDFHWRDTSNFYVLDCDITGCDCQISFRWTEKNFYISRTQPKELFTTVQYNGQEQNYNPILTPPEERSAVIRVQSNCTRGDQPSGTVTVTPVRGARLNYQTFPCGRNYTPPYGMVGITE
jgi:hypothetical protein